MSFKSSRYHFESITSVKALVKCNSSRLLKLVNTRRWWYRPLIFRLLWFSSNLLTTKWKKNIHMIKQDLKESSNNQRTINDTIHPWIYSPLLTLWKAFPSMSSIWLFERSMTFKSTWSSHTPKTFQSKYGILLPLKSKTWVCRGNCLSIVVLSLKPLFVQFTTITFSPSLNHCGYSCTPHLHFSSKTTKNSNNS